MKLIRYNSNLLCSLVRLDSARKLMAKGNVDTAIQTAKNALQFEDGRGMGAVRAELQKIVESQTTVQ
jgi:hypothetical protein